jgi:chromosome segregation ATPase
MAGRAIDEALDELYGADPAEFVAVRKRLVAGLRTAGDKDGAKQLGEARRPSTSAWALNQLARSRPELIEQLLDRSRELQRAQTRALVGDRDAMRDSIRAHRATLEAATQAALAILGARASDAFRNEIVNTLRSASTDEDVGRVLQLGRLIREVDASAGFPHAAGLTVTALPDRTERARPETEKARATPDHAAEIRRREIAERDAQQRKERELAQAERGAAAAAADAARSQARVDKLERDLGDARRRLDDARAREQQAAAELAEQRRRG